MYPILMHLGAIEVRSYGLLLILSFYVGCALAYARAKRHGLDPQLLLSVCLLVFGAIVVGSRLLFVVEHLWSYVATPGRVVQLSEGGLSLYGGMLMAFGAVAVYVHVQRVSFALIADISIPAVALGEGFTRIGCFLNGCCFGKVSTLPWAVVFPPGSFPAQQFPGLALHPTQLYAALYGFAIAMLLLRIEKIGSGMVFGWFLVLYGLCRLLLDFVRYYDASSIVLTLSGVEITSYQLISLGLCILGGNFVRRAQTTWHQTCGIYSRRYAKA
jgi:phosphatidylglycerol:prolipoprotein diacylglycerol transferase